MRERNGVLKVIAASVLGGIASERLRPPETPRPNRAGRSDRLRAILDAALVRLVASVIAWRARVRSRRLLASFDDRMLRDIGIDRARVEKESTSSFWRHR